MENNEVKEKTQQELVIEMKNLNLIPETWNLVDSNDPDEMWDTVHAFWQDIENARYLMLITQVTTGNTYRVGIINIRKFPSE